MYKVLLADDEPWSLVTLKSCFNWSKYGFEVIRETMDPLEAYQFITKESVHAAFVDIRMPKLSGLDLIKKVKSEGFDTEFIIVSGFSDFSYAQQALRDRVFDYFLKPVQPDKTDELLERLSSYLKSKQLLDDINTFETLSEGACRFEDIAKTRRFRTSNKYYQALAISGKGPENHFLDAVSAKYPNILKLLLGCGKYFCIINTNNDLKKDVLEIYDSHLWDDTHIGLSRVSGSKEDVPALLKEAQIAVNTSFMKDSPGVFQYHPPKYQFVNDILNEVYSVFEFPKYNVLKKLVTELPGKFVSNGLGIEEAVYFWNQVVAYVLKSSAGDRINSELEFMDCNDIINSFGSFSLLCEYSYDLLLSLDRKTQSNGKSDLSSKNFSMFLEYINQNYHRDLYLKQLASDFHYNFTYCSDLFRKTTGFTFTQYITNLRMKKASELLLDTNLCLEDICEAVGYNDYYYFNNIFKKHHSCPPLKYRKLYKHPSAEV